MNRHWENEFHERMDSFACRHQSRPHEISVSIKIRVNSGCFHREHSPEAYSIIDNYLDNAPKSSEFEFEEHESGPEILTYLAVTTAGIVLFKSVIDLITAIINAKAKGVHKGDPRRDSLTLIVRRTRDTGEFLEENVLEIHSTQTVDVSVIEEAIIEASKRLIGDSKKDLEI